MPAAEACGESLSDRDRPIADALPPMMGWMPTRGHDLLTSCRASRGAPSDRSKTDRRDAVANSKPRLRVESFTISLDGYGAGPRQDLDNPLGVGGTSLHGWAFTTRTFRKIFGQEGGATGIDEEFAARGFANIGAWIMGRNMFGPIRGPWPDDSWKGWWGDVPPYHCPVFVLTNHRRAPLSMHGGTTFHFVTDGIDAALDRAKEAAKGKDIRLGGGVATIRQYLQAGLIDELHLAISPVLLGSGEHLLGGLDAVALGYACTRHVPTEHATHVVLTRKR
jgi:dihydrofolate reductase